jgi:hypothetical protein
MAVATAQRSRAPVRQTAPAVTPARTRAPAPLRPATHAYLPDNRPARRLGGGEPMAGPMRRRIESSFGASLRDVRVHRHVAADQLGAHAFTLGPNIVLGSRARADDVGLMAHESAHTIQQGGGMVLQRFSKGGGDSHESEAHQASQAVLRGDRFNVTGRTSGPTVQRLGVSDALNYFADKANLIPGFRMFTIILGVNPINMSAVPRNAANILRALVEFIPGGGLITQALDNYGIFDKIGAWVEQQIQTLGMVGGSIKQALSDFIDTLGLGDLFDLGGVWNRAKKIFTEPIDRIINFAKGLATDIIKFIKDAILKPIASLAEGTAGYDLLKGVLGKDPITDEPVPRTAETLVGPFMKLIGQEEVWENMKKANAIARCWAWFQGALAELNGFVAQVPGLFLAAFQALELTDIILLPRAFAKLAKVFGGFLARFITWAGNAVWELLKIIFEVVAPGAIPYLKKVAASFKKILGDPIAFVKNLVKAGKQGFQQFADKIGTHLKNSLIEWLTGSLPGVYIPKALELREVIKFVLSVLGLTWDNIRQKLVKGLGEPAVKALETGFTLVKKLVTEGPAAAWELIKEQLANLKDMVMQGIIDFVVETIVKKAVAKIISLLIPGGAFIQAILTVYDTIMVFVDKLKKIIQVVTAFLDSIMAIADGVIGAAADKIESTLAGLLTLAISFLAGFAGLGKIADKVMNIINTKVRAPIDKAIDFVVGWISKTAKAFLSKLTGAAREAVAVKGTPQERLSGGLAAARDAVNRLSGSSVGLAVLRPLLAAIKLRYGMQSLEAVPRDGRWAVVGKVNPEGTLPTDKLTDAGDDKNFPTQITYYPADGERGANRMVANPLGRDHPQGSRPSESGAPPVWNKINLRRNNRRLYVLGHLLNNQLGGTGGAQQNLTPITFSANSTHHAQVEGDLKGLVNASAKSAKRVYYEVKVNYPGSPRTISPALKNRGVADEEGTLATSFTWKWYLLKPKDGDATQLVKDGSDHTGTVPNITSDSVYPQTQ